MREQVSIGINYQFLQWHSHNAGKGSIQFHGRHSIVGWDGRKAVHNTKRIHRNSPTFWLVYTVIKYMVYTIYIYTYMYGIHRKYMVYAVYIYGIHCKYMVYTANICLDIELCCHVPTIIYQFRSYQWINGDIRGDIRWYPNILQCPRYPKVKSAGWCSR